MIELLFYFAFKHFVGDALLQTPYQYLNKGKFFHPGGHIHAGIHALLSMIGYVILAIDLILIVKLIFIEYFLHFAIDYIKINCGSNKYSSHGLDSSHKPCLRIYDNLYFYWLIFDQCLHFATYVLLYWLVII